MRHRTLGRYSFLMADPVQWVQADRASSDHWRQVCKEVEEFQLSIEPGNDSFLPPFIGGAAGLVSYDWSAAVEDIPPAKRDDFLIPKFAFGVFDGIVAWDHFRNECWVIAVGFPESSLQKRELAARERIHKILGLVDEAENGIDSFARNSSNQNSRSVGLNPLDLSQYFRLDKERIGKHFPDHQLKLSGKQRILTGTELNQYLQSIEKAKEHLQQGDIFQVNLAQQLLVESSLKSSEVYKKLRRANPAPFAAFLDLGDSQVMSASPERLFSLQYDGKVETRPIKGTCPRTGDEIVDQLAGERLQQSRKDCAENVMIVDLLRNDLSKVCQPDSVTVTALCELEPYQFVQHLTSVVEGKLDKHRSVCDLLLALFPGGSITGAPKVRAMEIIQQQEPVARGPYCGSMGYMSFGKVDRVHRSDFNILIRTMTQKDGWCQVPVGGGIVLDSEPKSEFDETLVKAHGMLRALL